MNKSREKGLVQSDGASPKFTVIRRPRSNKDHLFHPPLPPPPYPPYQYLVTLCIMHSTEVVYGSMSSANICTMDQGKRKYV